MKILDLFAEVGFKFDSMKVAEFTHLLGDLNIASIVGATSLVGLGESIHHVLDQASQTAIALNSLKTATALDPHQSDQFERYAEIMGAAKGSAESFLKSLSKLRFSVLYEGGNPQFYNLTNIKPQDPIFKQIDDLNKRFNDTKFLDQYAASQGIVGKSYDEIRAALKAYIADTAGASSDLLPFLTSQVDTFQKYKQTIAFTNEEVDKSVEAFRTWHTAVNELDVAVQKLVMDLNPFLSSTIKAVTKIVELTDKFVFKPGFAKDAWKVQPAFPDLHNDAMKFFSPKSSGASGKWEQNNRITIHITGDEPHAISQKVKDELKKALANADGQWSLQSI